MLDSISETRLAAVHPELKRRIEQLAALLSFDLRVTQGLRTYFEQDALYAQGRTAHGEIVTHAPGGYSAHNMGYAVDVAPIGPDGIDWNGKDAKWEEILAKAPSCRLAEGAEWRTFPDEPHLYLEELWATPTDEMRAAYLAGGLQEVWKQFDLDSQETLGSA